jgi:5-methylcytosine-specific restriction enzyme subunit McrC
MNAPHCIHLREWEERLLHIELTPADRVSIHQFNKSGSTGIRIEELRDSVRIQTTSSIGVVRLDSIEIRVEPKLAGDNIRVVEMLEVTTGIDLLRRYEKSHELQAEEKNLFELLVLLLVSETERLIRSGLLSNYHEEEGLLPVIRGRFLGDQQLLRRFGMLDKLHCRFDELSQNIVENQVLAAALAASEPFIVNNALRHRVRHCLGDLLACCDPHYLDVQTAKQLFTYNRLNHHYRPAHELCWLVLEQTGIEDVLTRGRTSCFSFLLNMNQLFEQFVAVLIRKLLEPQGFRIKSQHKDASIIRHAVTNKSYAKVIPDLRVYSPADNNFCIDAKYKLYDELKISNSDIYQAFLYAFAFATSPVDRHAFLIFPSEQAEDQSHHLTIKCGDGSAARITAIGIHIPTVLEEWHRLDKGGLWQLSQFMDFTSHMES